MSYLDAPPFWRRWIDDFHLDEPRVTGGLALAAALALALAWQAYGPKPLPEDATRIQPPSYPLRFTLPDSAPMLVEQLNELAQSNDALADIAIEAGVADQATLERRRNSDEFNRAFADAFSEGRTRTAPVDLEPGDFLSVDYNMAELEPAPERYDRSDGSLTVEKPLFVDGVSSGPATIRIEEGAQILIATSSVARALGEKASRLPRRITTALASGSGFIPFYELRGAGIQVEYDAARDRVSMSMPS